MQDFQQRVVDEKADLDAKISKLSGFIIVGDTFPALPKRDQDLLVEQRDLMEKYSQVLGVRIERF